MRHPSRRAFCLVGLAGAAQIVVPSGWLAGQTATKSSGATRPDVEAIDHDRILGGATDWMQRPITPITSFPAKRSLGLPHDYYSEPEDYFPATGADAGAAWTRRANQVNPDAFTAHREAVFHLGTGVADLTAAFVATGNARYAARAGEHLRAWFIAPSSRMTPSLEYGHRIPNAPTGRPEGLIETVPLAEVARSIRFLAGSGALTAEELGAVQKWFAEYATWMNESRTGGLARDMKDLNGSSWLFQSAAYADANVAGLSSDDATLNALRHRFRTATLRAEITGTGIFSHVISSPNPYRDCLFNLDMLCLACELMTTRFDNPWEFELQDGPGLRAAIAFHFPFMVNRGNWPYPADLFHFKDLPARRISLLLAGHAYRRPEYVDLWRSLQPPGEGAAPELQRSFAVSQPLLWVTQPRRISTPK